MKRLFTLAALLLLLPPSPLAAAAPPPAARPNIILILADDLGFSDLGCYGGEIQTPNLDRLAQGGLRFSQFYNCALCGPSRAALMTGLHPHQVGITNWTGLLNNRCVTVIELLHRAGYTTAAAGRLDMVTAENWHDPAMISRCVDRFLGSTGHTGPGNYFKAVRGGDFFAMVSRSRCRRKTPTKPISSRISPRSSSPRRRGKRNRSSSTSPTTRRTGRCTRSPKRLPNIARSTASSAGTRRARSGTSA